MKSIKIGVIGATGIGKTTFIEQFCNRFDALPFYEEWSENPFMKDFYEGKKFFENQLWFIKNDIERAKKALKTNNKQYIIIDKLFIQNYAFVNITKLKYDEKIKCFEYLDIHKRILENIDIVINIAIDEFEIVNRIKKRNRAMEQDLTIDWFKSFQLAQQAYLRDICKEYKFKLISFDNSKISINDIFNEISKIEKK